MRGLRRVDRVWLLLVGLTLGSAWLGEAAEAGLAATLAVALLIALKGRLVIDHYMELAGTNRRIRRLMNGYFYVIPGLVVATRVFGDLIARLTAW
jgi:hypothetical protein